MRRISYIDQHLTYCCILPVSVDLEHIFPPFAVNVNTFLYFGNICLLQQHVQATVSFYFPFLAIAEAFIVHFELLVIFFSI